MLSVAELRNEHDLLLVLADELEAVSVGDPPFDLTPIFVRLSRFAQLLQIHLLREDSLLYPALIASGDRRLAAVAATFQDELGDLDILVEAYEQKWTGSAISYRWADFCEDTGTLLRRVRTRIHREDEGLYPLLEGLTELAA